MNVGTHLAHAWPANTTHPANMHIRACCLHLKVRRQPAAAQDGSRVTADAHGAARLEHASAIQHVCRLVARHSAFVHSHLQQVGISSGACGHKNIFGC